MTVPARSWWMILTPLLLAALLSFHPMPEGDVIYDGLRDQVTPWLIVHVGLAGGACLIGLALHRLLRGMTGLAATVSRVALVPFVACFVAWEATLGIGSGVMVNYANGLPAGPRRDAVSDAIQEIFMNPLIGDVSVIGSIGNGAWIVAVIAAAFAVRRAGVGIAAVILLCLASLFTLHSIIVGPIGLVCLAGAALLIERSRVGAAVGTEPRSLMLRASAPSPATRPRSARAR